MWSRRLLRAGWLIAPLFSLPGKIVRFPIRALRFLFYNERHKCVDGFNVFFGVFLVAMFSTLCWTIYADKHFASAATAEAVTDALKDNACMTDLMPRRYAEFQRPLTYGDLRQGQRDCTAVYEAHYNKIAQEKAMAALGAKK